MMLTKLLDDLNFSTSPKNLGAFKAQTKQNVCTYKLLKALQILFPLQSRCLLEALLTRGTRKNEAFI